VLTQQYNEPYKHFLYHLHKNLIPLGTLPGTRRRGLVMSYHPAREEVVRGEEYVETEEGGVDRGEEGAKEEGGGIGRER
jgi:hypothetical protein